MATLHLPRLGRDPVGTTAAPRSQTLSAALWALCGGLVILFIFFAALGAFDPTEAVELTVAALVLSVLWLAHSWRRLWLEEASPRADRERRGY